MKRSIRCEKIMGTADLASSLDKAATPELEKRLKDPDSAVRYWAALGLLMRGIKQPLENSLTDASPYVRIVAAEALGRYGTRSRPAKGPPGPGGSRAAAKDQRLRRARRAQRAR